MIALAMMNAQHTVSNFILTLTALIWGLAFVAQRVGMEFIGPMLFNGLRFSLGLLTLLPLYWVGRMRRSRQPAAAAGATNSPRSVWFWGITAGLALFAGSTFQQIGIVYTTAGNAGFITGLYIILVPIMGIGMGSRTGPLTWAAAGTALIGLYLISVKGGYLLALGDLLVFFSAFFWALHVHIIGFAASRFDVLMLSIIQYGVTALLSLAGGLLLEPVNFEAILNAGPAIVYGGVMSVGVAYTLQIVGQKGAHPAHAAIILSLEGAFAALGGWLILGETLSPRQMLGAGLMLGAMLAVQLAQLLKSPGVNPRRNNAPHPDGR